MPVLDTTITKNEWTPTLDKLDKSLSKGGMKRFWGDLGLRIVAVIKSDMNRERGFDRHKRYARLKIKYRYHGSKVLVGGKSTSKTKVDASTKPLRDIGDLWRSWDVLKFNSDLVEVGNQAPAEKEKAFYNDDRGDWNFEKFGGDAAMDRFLKHLDKALF